MKKQLVHVVLNNFQNDSRVLKECKVAIENGFDVHVFALHEKGLKTQENIDGINVNRIKLLTKNIKIPIIGNVVKYIEFSLKLIKKTNKLSAIKIIHCNDLGPLPICALIKKIGKDIKLLYDAHEYETEANGLKGFRKIMTTILERNLIHKVDHVITVSNSIACEYKRLYNIKKPDVILNVPYYDGEKSKSYKPNLFREKFNIVNDDILYLYQGGLMNGRGIDIILKAFSKVEENKHIVFLGNGPKSEVIEDYVSKYKNIHIHKAVPPNSLLEHTKSADIGICIIEPICKSYELALPNKFFEYSMSRLPVISNNLIEVNNIINEYNTGYQIEGEEDLIHLINNINMSDIKKKSDNTFKLIQDYNWQNETLKLSNIYLDLLKD